MKTNFSDVIGGTLKERGIQLDEKIKDKFEDSVDDFEKELDRDVEHLVKAIGNDIDKLNSNFKVNLGSQKENIIRKVFSNLTKS
jgi:hypothetical protein